MGLGPSSTLASASASGHTAQARDLVAQGANVDAPDLRGLTPVMLAVLGGHLDTAVQLALSGADLTCRNAEGRTALELAVLSANREVRAPPPRTGLRLPDQTADVTRWPQWWGASRECVLIT